jgi:uncharacterized damage-inducible protein DinB
MSGARVGDVLTALRGAFDRDGWHGPTVLEAIEGVSEELASGKPAGAHHSIHELVDHVVYWEAMGLHYLREGAAPASVPPDWPAASGRFADAVARMRRAHEELVATIGALDDSDLERPVRTVAGASRSLAEVLHGLATHAGYHAGQIRLLRTLLDAG